MPEQPEATTEQVNTQEPTTEGEGESGEKLTPPPALQAVIDKERENAREAEKARKALEKELNELRKSSMSESEKAVAEAEARGRAEAATQFGTRLVRSEFIAAAAKRNATFDAAAVLDDLNLAKFVNDDGDPDGKAITAAVNRLVPEMAGSPSFEGGARTSPPVATGMNDFIRKATGRA